MEKWLLRKKCKKKIKKAWPMTIKSLLSDLTKTRNKQKKLSSTWFNSLQRDLVCSLKTKYSKDTAFNLLRAVRWEKTVYVGIVRRN